MSDAEERVKAAYVERVDEIPSEVDGTLTPVSIPVHPAQLAALSRLTIDFGRPTGPVHGGATGMLYGLSDPGVPARQLISGAAPRTIAQKAPGGQQHPNGDAVVIAPDFVAAGGSQILVYLQDDYAQWPYEFLGIDDYAQRVVSRVRSALESQHPEIFAWVPFNEPDWIWYRDGEGERERERFFEHWAIIHAAIRSVDPTGPIVGPNDMEYRPARLRDFLSWAADSDVLPDVMSWHELSPASLGAFDEHLRDYRALESELGVGPLPINIDEYGNRRDMSVPGQLIQWVSMFERAKVDADLAYWTMAGNLDDHAVRTSEANGGWWLLFWYARLTGHTVHVQPPAPGVPDTLQAVAAVEPERRRATIILGGTAGRIELAAIGARELAEQLRIRRGDQVRVLIEETTWSGQEGHAARPRLIDVIDAEWAGSLPVITIDRSDRMAAYRVTIDADHASAPTSPGDDGWWVRYEAEDAAIEHGRILVHDDDAQKYSASGGRDVGGLTHPDSAVTFSIVAPSAGSYDVVLTYGTAGEPARRALYLDGEFAGLIECPATLSTDYRGQTARRMDLPAGPCELSLRASSPHGPVGGAAVTLDMLEVRPTTPRDAVTWPLRDADLAAGVRQSGDALRFEPHGTARLWVSADDDGYHEIVVALPGSAGMPRIELNGIPLDLGGAGAAGGRPSRVSVVVYLARGISELTLAARDEAIVVRGVHVLRRPDLDGRTETLAMPVGVDLDAAPLHLERPPGIAAGRTVITLAYANGAKQEADNYNTDVVSLRVCVRQEGEGGGAVVVPCRHSYSWDNYWTTGAIIDLNSDAGHLTLAAIDDRAPRIAWVSLSPLVAEVRVGEEVA